MPILGKIPNTTNPAISLVQNKSATLCITRRENPAVSLCPVTGNGHGGVTKPGDDQFCDQNLGTLPNESLVERAKSNKLK